MNSYTATIVDEHQGLLSCSSTNTSCKIPNLKCDQMYTVTVCHHDGMCPSMPSEAIYMDSGRNTSCSKHVIPNVTLCRYISDFLSKPLKEVYRLLTAQQPQGLLKLANSLYCLQW